MTALHIMGRMKKDWIHLGRRPSALCGAGTYNKQVISHYFSTDEIDFFRKKMQQKIYRKFTSKVQESIPTESNQIQPKEGIIVLLAIRNTTFDIDFNSFGFSFDNSWQTVQLQRYYGRYCEVSAHE